MNFDWASPIVKQFSSRQIRRSENIVGKTIQCAVEMVDDFVLVFSDGKYAAISSSGYECDHYAVLCSEHRALSLYELVKVGFLTEEEREAEHMRMQAKQDDIAKEVAKKKAEAKEKRDHSEYKRLKKKFEGVEVE